MPKDPRQQKQPKAAPIDIEELGPHGWSGLAFAQGGKIARLETALRAIRTLARRYQEEDPVMLAVLRVVDDALWDEEEQGGEDVS